MVARIFAVIDVINAKTTERPYSKPWPNKQAIEHIREHSCKHFDPDVVQTFLKIVDRLY
jgi:HD-GYP domain-containing protein (c-di-GMP phosphodiesterase class II)